MKGGNTILYKVFNINNNREYIGITKRSLRVRLIEHLSRLKKGVHPSQLMKEDYHLYGKQSFKIEVVKSGNFNDMCLMEKELTRSTIITGYNIIIGGMDNEERASAANVFRNKLNSDPALMKEFIRKISVGNIGKKMSLEARDKMSKTRKGRVWEDERKLNRSKAYSGAANPNAGKYRLYLNVVTGIYYTTPELYSYLGKNKSMTTHLFKTHSPIIKNFIKV